MLPPIDVMIEALEAVERTGTELRACDCPLGHEPELQSLRAVWADVIRAIDHVLLPQ